MRVPEQLPKFTLESQAEFRKAVVRIVGWYGFPPLQGKGYTEPGFSTLMSDFSHFIGKSN